MDEDSSIEQAFENLGIPRMQAKVYLDLIRHGKSGVPEIAQRTKIHRTNVYDILGKLKERNLVYLSHNDGKRLFAALSIDFIMQEQKHQLESVNKVLNHVKNIHPEKSYPNIIVVEGVDAIKDMLFHLLEEGKPIWMYGLAEKENVLDLINSNVLNSFHLERLKKKIHLKCLFYKYPVEKMKDINSLKLIETRLLPKGSIVKESQSSQILCNNTLCFILWGQEIQAIHIEHPLLAKEFQDFYNILWDVSSDIFNQGFKKD